MDLLVNIDVPDLDAAERFYVEAFGLKPTRRIGSEGLELSGWPARVYLLEKAAGTVGASDELRRYDRHWSPVHLDVSVDDIDAALARALAAGAVAETEVRTASWGKIVVLADPFGHGICLIQFLGRGYDEIATPARLLLTSSCQQAPLRSVREPGDSIMNAIAMIRDGRRDFDFFYGEWMVHHRVLKRRGADAAE